MNAPNESGNRYAEFGPQNLQQQRVFQSLKQGDSVDLGIETRYQNSSKVSCSEILITDIDQGHIVIDVRKAHYMPAVEDYTKNLSRITNCVVSFHLVSPPFYGVIDVFPDGTMKTEDGKEWQPPWKKS